MKKIAIAGALVLVAFLGILFSGRFMDSHKRPPVMVQPPVHPSAGLSAKPIADSTAMQPPPLPPSAMPGLDDRYATGVVEPFVDVTLGLFVQGRIEKILLSEGRRVRKGDVILMLEKRQEELEAARRKIIWLNRAELVSAELAAKTLTQTLKDNRMLYDQTHSVSREELSQLTMQWQQAVSQRDLLRNQEQREKVEYEMALNAVASRILKAPSDGIVEKLFLKEGEVCQPAQPLVRLIDFGRCLLTVNLDDSKNYLIEKGMDVELLISNGAQEVRKQGVVVKPPDVVDAASGVMQVKVLFDNHDGTVKPGVTGRMRLPEGK